MRYFVGQYDEAPVEPEPAREFATLTDARRYAEMHYGGERDTTLAGQKDEAGYRLVEMLYTNEHQSAGCWIASLEDE